MIDLSRRRFLFTAAATLAVIRTPGLLMPVKTIPLVDGIVVTMMPVGSSMMFGMSTFDANLWADRLRDELRKELMPLIQFRQFANITPGPPYPGLERIA